jgi:hypothetical protein
MMFKLHMIDTVAHLLKARSMSQTNSRYQRTALKQHSRVGNGPETDNRTTSVARQQVLNNNRGPLLENDSLNTFTRQRIHMHQRNGVFYVVRADML